MSIRRNAIEEQAKRLRNYVSGAVFAVTGQSLSMTQTLDQMVRSAAKARITLHIVTGSHLHAVEVIRDQISLIEIERTAEVEGLRSALAAIRELIMREAKIRGMLDESNKIACRHPRRKALVEQIDAVLGETVSVPKELV